MAHIQRVYELLFKALAIFYEICINWHLITLCCRSFCNSLQNSWECFFLCICERAFPKNTCIKSCVEKGVMVEILVQAIFLACTDCVAMYKQLRKLDTFQCVQSFSNNMIQSRQHCIQKTSFQFSHVKFYNVIVLSLGCDSP